VEELVDSIVKSGFQKVILTNSHGGNTDLLNLIARDLRIKHGIEIYVMDWWFTPFWNDIMQTEKESASPYGVFHACELETSLIMAIAPETVCEERIADETPDEMFRDNRHITLYGPVNMGWKTKDVTKSGVIGAPSYASAEKGEKFLAYATDRLEEIVNEVLKFTY
jgi:creatinine amidohydrolase